jgi:hypothetical protein
MIIRATQKKMMSKPVTSTRGRVEGLSRSVSSGQPRVLKGHSAELNQVSSTSSSWRSGKSAPGRACRAPPARRAADVDIALGVVPGRDAVAPPELAADAPVLDVAHPGEVGVLPVVRHEAMRPSSTARWPVGQRSSLHVPLVGQEGLDDGAGAVAARHHELVVVDALEQSQGARGPRRCACAPRSGPCRRGRSSGSLSRMAASGVKMLISPPWGCVAIWFSSRWRSQTA